MGRCSRNVPLIIGIVIPTNVPGVTVLQMSHFIIAIHTTIPRVCALKTVLLVIAVNVPTCHLSMDRCSKNIPLMIGQCSHRCSRNRFSRNVPLVIAINVPTDIPWIGFLEMSHW